MDSLDLDRLLDGLTEPQREAVVHRDGPLLVLAAAGSGKTRVITRRAAYLAATCAGPRGVLAITFTNKAAAEMRQRVNALGAYGMTVCTFHALCARLLRQYADRAGIGTNYSIFDQSDQLRAVKQAMEACELDTSMWKPGVLLNQVSLAKNRMETPDDLAERSDVQDRVVAQVFRRYEELLQENNALDFDDLLIRTAALLADDTPLRDALEAQWPYLLIDEYQDTNRAQYLIARRLTMAKHNICATGDPDQSIYGWRGANINNILEFEDDYPNAKVVRLEQNYRSTKRILSAAGRLIKSNLHRKPKELWTDNDQGGPVHVMICESAHDEADRIVAQIRMLIERGYEPGQMAIFYRINALTRVIEDALRNAGLPYQIARGVEFYNRKEIKDALSYLRVLANPADAISLGRIINTPTRGIGAKTIERLVIAAKTSGVGLMEAIGEPGKAGLGAGPAKKVKAFAEMMGKLSGMAAGGKVKPIVEAVLRRTQLEDSARQQYGEDSDQVDNLNELVTAAAEFDEQPREDGPALLAWLEQVSLVSDIDALEEGAGAVSLMTLHAAKGLEFDVVFVAGLEDGLLPHSRAKDEPMEMEEERRLCFVGMTRARQVLTLSRAEYRTLRGQSMKTIPSGFLDELPREDIEVIDYTEGRRNRGWREWSNKADEGESVEYLKWKPGQMMYHQEYGVGRLVRVSRLGGRMMARVRFNHYGEKTLSATQGDLEAVEL